MEAYSFSEWMLRLQYRKDKELYNTIDKMKFWSLVTVLEGRNDIELKDDCMIFNALVPKFRHWCTLCSYYANDCKCFSDEKANEDRYVRTHMNRINV